MRSSVKISSGRLDQAIRSLALQTGVEILFTPDVVGDRRSRKLTGRFSAEEALLRLVGEFGLRVGRVGNVLIVVPADATQPAPATPEILVMGSRTQNVDIRRTQNDIQPYRVLTRRELLSSHADTVDQFLRTRLPSNTESRPPSLDAFGGNRSQVDLHGLGESQTLILIDGARMPSSISYNLNLALDQPDLNALPLLAIDRIETLTGTAGGIYGPGATGGVVNIVMRRRYRGIEAATTFGASARADAPRGRLDLLAGFTPDHGRTDLMLAYSYGRSKGLRFGDRRYPLDVQAQRIAAGPQNFEVISQPINGVLFATLDQSPLRIDAARGGGTLGASYTYLPTGFTGERSALIDILRANAGRLPEGLSPDAAGVRRNLTNDTKTTSLLFNVRRRVVHGLDIFLDLVRSRNDGRADYNPAGGSPLILGGNSPINPFEQTIAVNFPQLDYGSSVLNAVSSSRMTAGVLGSLPLGWKLDASIVRGVSRNQFARDGWQATSALSADFSAGRPGAATGLVADPFGDWETFQTALTAYRTPSPIRIATRGTLTVATGRASGPLFSTSAGKVTLTALAEQRTEKSRRTLYVLGASGNIPGEFGFVQHTSTAYGEMRIPLVRSDAATVLRGTELQLALRYDRLGTDLTSNEPYARRQRALAYTLGARAFPFPRLMLRASVATGVLPPTPAQLTPNNFQIRGGFFADPKRPGKQVGGERSFRYIGGGSPRMRSEHARTWTIGAVYNPDGESPRVSLDYRRIKKTDEIVTTLSSVYFLLNESLFPDRVQRAALTDADRAAGYTGGVVEILDNSPPNIGRTVGHNLDLTTDASWSLGRYRIHAYGSATWSPKLRRHLLPTLPTLDYVGYLEGTLRWRGNAGLDVLRDNWSAGLNGQFYAPHNAVEALSPSLEPPTAAELAVPGVRIPSQFYLDGYASLTLPLDHAAKGRRVEFRAGIQNMLDRRPAYVSTVPAGYSYYGDARGRRFEVSVQIDL